MPLKQRYGAAIGELAKALSDELEKRPEKKPVEPGQPEASASTADSEVLRLAAAPDYLSEARRDIQRNVRAPISIDDALELIGLLESIYDLLTVKKISDKLQQQQQRIVSQSTLAESACTLLDKVNGYMILAQHFFNPQVIDARIGRTSDVVKAEVTTVSGEASSLKEGIRTYLLSVEDALRKTDLRE
jgi:hypothetical protein